MKGLLQILIIILFLGGHIPEKGLDGLWYGAYSIIDNKSEQLHQPVLLEFKDNLLITIKIRDFSTGELDKVTIDTTVFTIDNSVLKFETYSLPIEYSEDSIILISEEINKKLVLKRLPETFKNKFISEDCFSGSYLIKSKYYQDSLDFINDSLLIFTGKYDQNFPEKRWQIIDYNGYKFLNIHKEFLPIMIIESCNSKSIKLLYPSIENIEVILTQTKSKIDKKILLGIWKEIDNPQLQLPEPLPLSKKDRLYKIEILKDSLKIYKNSRVKTYKWGLTSDGKRIYFINKNLMNAGSWKLLNITDSTMTLRLITQNGFIEERIKFKKE